jgi:hypothetical protein
VIVFVAFIKNKTCLLHDFRFDAVEVLSLNKVVKILQTHLQLFNNQFEVLIPVIDLELLLVVKSLLFHIVLKLIVEPDFGLGVDVGDDEIEDAGVHGSQRVLKVIQ